MAQHNELGKAGEELAAEYLINKGYHILAQNWRFGKNEIDIIAEDATNLVIAEVKTRTVSECFNIPDLIKNAKERFLITAAQAYIQQNKVDKDCRFDAIIVVKQYNGSFVVEHIECAFYPRA